MAVFPSAVDGFLPYALFVTSTMALVHSVVTYIRPIPALTAFSGPSAPPPNALTAHIYGVKNIYTGLIRLYAAYNIHNRELYTLAILTYAGVLFLYGGELFIWQTTRMREAFSALFIPTTMLYWMLIQKGWYLLDN
ncbi:conserved hypothetical protein [Talaromyces stipitatus ATCC 10500]|uniref:Ergosterol biosynthesis protein Erg28 n=1 Tax=Talaromyces stipitatus (strain ATCC 10500 / CBS 375.48 / QM 6759 / NRRL 1006) TaxID=441959 RepID=B8LWX9_TALSN|nr:uncharacterized protein TSTA_079670 [Talaromyces stipitatus ATCC 10500]EED24612.1 conserved hypothetical protein [Talaromyces stipitatus ATCC 10500]